MTFPAYETCWNSARVDDGKTIGVDSEANAQMLKGLFYDASDNASG